MKKLGIWLFIIFIFVAGIYAVLQGNIGRNYARHLFTSVLSQSGFEVQIDQIEGTLPNQIDLKGISIQGNGMDITIAELKLRPILWRLLKKEIAFKAIHAKEISFSKGTPFDFDGKFRMNKKKGFLVGHIFDWLITSRFNRAERSAQFTAKNPLLFAKGKAFFDTNFKLLPSKIQIGSDQLLSKLPFSASGRFLANLTVTQENNGLQGEVRWQIPNLIVEKVEVGTLRGKGEASLENRVLKGEFTATPFAKGSLNLEILPNWQLLGTSEIDIENLQSLHIPNAYGKLHAKGEWHIQDQSQGLYLDLTATDFYYGSFFAQKISLYSDLQDLFNKNNYLLDLEVEKGKWHSLELETASFETRSEGENHPFHLFAEGKWKHPLEVNIAGSWKDHFVGDIQTLTGTFFNHPFILTKPVHFEKTNDLFRLPDVEISIANATAFLHVNRQGDLTDARLRFRQLPLDFLSLNPLDISIGGVLDLEADIHEKNNRLQGDLIASIGHMEPLDASGKFEGHFNRELLDLKGNLHVHEEPILNLEMSLPIHFSLWPFDATILTHKKTKGHIALNGRIEDLIDFVDLGPHRLEGKCTCDLNFSNTLYRPFVEGYLLFENGFYENYYTGTELHNIAADFVAKKNLVTLRSFTAQDKPKTGSMSANGKIELFQGNLYPFHLDLVFENLKFAEIDLVTSSAEGKITIEGNATSALAKGDIQIIESDLTIPDHIPRPLPDLPVVYRNSTHPVPPPQADYKPYPLFLDLNVLAPQAITISGRGLSSEWKGDFHLGGTYTALAAKGKLELITGEFNFSSRSFKLTEGSLSLSGIEHEMPYLNLAGAMDTKGISIIARLKGPLDDPQITLQSVPPLPLGSIMSYLLFGQDLSEISGFQALQLATSLASLAGTGPDIMENTRRSLGIDRLRVITEPTEEGGETVALQVGKYVSKGVLVSFSQGTDESSTNVSVEIELKDNFVFQIESDQHQEQGKFTLKWNLNY